MHRLALRAGIHKISDRMDERVLVTNSMTGRPPMADVRLDAIAFRAVGTPLGEGLLKSRGRFLHAAGKLKTDDWNGETRVQLQIEDAAAAGA